ncbi:MAG: DUF433 domain-containing protein [Phycisphaerales bacterium]
MDDRVKLLERVTQRAGYCGGRPCIRGLRIRVSDVLDMLAAGVDKAEILSDFPSLEPDDVRACLYFGALRASSAAEAG